MNGEELCKICEGPGTALGTSCYWCEGTGVVIEEGIEELDNTDYIQDSFEQHGPPEPNKEPSIKMDMDGIHFYDKNGNLVSHVSSKLIEPINFINIKINFEDGKTLTGGEGVIMPINEGAESMFEQFVGAVKQVNDARVSMRYLTVWGIDELLDLYAALRYVR